ncbi:MAG: flagellar protein FlaG [Chloroflexota bacterium]
MDPIKPIEGILKDGEGQASVLAEVVRDSYWKHKAQETPAIEASEEATDDTTKRGHNQDESKSQVSMHRTYAEFEINRETREIIVRIIDAESGSLVRTIPPDELAKEIIKGNLNPNQLRRRAILV